MSKINIVSLDNFIEELGIKMTEEDYEWFKNSEVDPLATEGYHLGENNWQGVFFKMLEVHTGSADMANQVADRLSKYVEQASFPKVSLTQFRIIYTDGLSRKNESEKE